jgi:hypothetical protein
MEQELVLSDYINDYTNLFFIADKYGNILKEVYINPDTKLNRYEETLSLIIFNIKDELFKRFQHEYEDLEDQSIEKFYLVSEDKNVYLTKFKDNLFLGVNFRPGVKMGIKIITIQDILEALQDLEIEVPETKRIDIKEIPVLAKKEYGLNPTERRYLKEYRETLYKVIDQLAEIYFQKAAQVDKQDPEIIAKRKKLFVDAFRSVADGKIDEEGIRFIIRQALGTLKISGVPPQHLTPLLLSTIFILKRLVRAAIKDPVAVNNIMSAFRKAVYLALNSALAIYMYTAVNLIEKNTGIDQRLLINLLSTKIPKPQIDENLVAKWIEDFGKIIELTDDDLEQIYRANLKPIFKSLHKAIKTTKVLNRVYTAFHKIVDAWFEEIEKVIDTKGINNEFWKKLYELGLTEELDFRMVYAFLRLKLALERESFKNMDHDIYLPFLKFLAFNSGTILLGMLDRIKFAFENIITIPHRTIVRHLEV